MRYQQPYGVVDVNASYVNGVPSIGRQGSIPPAAAFEEPMREIVACITGAGFTPSGGNGTAGGDLTQLWKAIQIAPWIDEYAPDSGVANSYAVNINPVPPQLYPGMSVRVKIANTNTGASTLAVNTLGAHAIKRASGVDLAAGDLMAGELAFFMFDGSNWQITNFLGFTSDTTVNNFTLSIPYAVDSGAVNALVALFSPAVTVLGAGNPFIVKVSHANTGSATLKANALPAAPLQWPDGSALRAGDIVAGGLIFVIFDGTNFQLMCRINGLGGSSPPTNPTVGVTGTIDDWPTETAPTGAYECNGAAYTVAGDPNLFAIIGTRFGNAGPGTFKVPDLRGRFTRGWSHSTGNDPDANTRTDRGDGTAGDHVGTIQTDNFKSHLHPFSGSISGRGLTANGQSVYGVNEGIAPSFGGDFTTAGYNGGTLTYLYGIYLSGGVTGNTGAVGGAETRPVNVAMMKIIWR
jgi:microcystin-dependent protein